MGALLACARTNVRTRHVYYVRTFVLLYERSYRGPLKFVLRTFVRTNVRTYERSYVRTFVRRARLGFLGVFWSFLGFSGVLVIAQAFWLILVAHRLVGTF